MQYAVQLPKSDRLTEHPGGAKQALGLLLREQGPPHCTSQRVTGRFFLGRGEEKGRTLQVCDHARHCSEEKSCLRVEVQVLKG